MTALFISLLATFGVALVLERSNEISRAIIRNATRCLPPDERADREAQYLSDSDAVEGAAWTLLNAVGCAWLCRSAIVRQLGRSIAKATNRFRNHTSGKSDEPLPEAQLPTARVKIELGPKATMMIEGLDVPPNRAQILRELIRKELAKNPSLMDGPRSLEQTEDGPKETVTFELVLPRESGTEE